MFQKHLKSVFILFSLLTVLLLVNVGHSQAAQSDSPIRISSLNETLGMNIHSPEEDILDVPSRSPLAGDATGDNFTIVALPDTQHYSDNGTNFQIFINQTAWIIAQRESRNIVLVDHLGDIVNDNNDEQWNRAAQALLNLNQNNIAIGIAPGNHDYNSVLGSGTNNNSPADRYDRNLPATSALATSYGNGIVSYDVHDWYGGYKGGVDSSVTGSYDNRLWKDNYVLFSAGGMDFINIAAEYNFPTDTATWIDAVLDAYPTRRAIISTHQFLEDDNTVSTEGGIPAVLANVLAEHCNVFLILSGHNHSGTTPGEAQRTETNSCGKPVYLLMSDYQDETNGGDGWLRIMTFQPGTDTIGVETYSPTRNSGTGDYKTDSDSQFTLSYDMVSANTTVQVRVGASSDDAEQNISTNAIDLTSSDLELIRDSGSGGFDQIVGMRFQNVLVPDDAVIQSAYIEFETDETTNINPSALTIRGQAADNPTTFTSATSNISGRPLTAASAAWAPGAWNTVDVKHQTPDISAVVQEIVNRGGWASGNAMVYMISGSGQRVAEAYDGEAAAAPLLVIEYNIPPTEPPAAPTDLSATAASPTRIDLSWTDNADNEDDFEIERSTAGSIGTFTLLTTVAANTTTYADTGLNAESTYCYRVRATNSLGNSDYTAIACATTPEATTETVTFQQGVDGYTGAVDTFIRELAADANTNFSASNVLEWDDNTDEVTLIRFNNLFNSEGGPIPNGATIVSASLRYMTTDLSGTSTAQGDPANVYESLVDWPVATVTWNNFGGEAGVQANEYVDLIASAPATAASTAYTINTTASLQQWSANPTSNLGWVFLPTAADGVTLYSSEAATTANRPLLTVTYAIPPEVPTGWIAYNDSAWASGQLTTNVTNYTITSGSTTGLLKDYITGNNTPVTAAFTVNGVPVITTGTGGGSETAPGTDAYNTFHGIVDMPGVIRYGSASWWVEVTFTGLDPAKTYAFTTSANRAGAYTDRITRFTLSDATTAVNTSSTGVTKKTTTFANDTSAFNTGENTANGYVASWTGIQPGVDGDFKVRAQADTAVNEAYAFSVFKLQLEIVPLVWDGGGVDNNWSTAANWVGDVAPTAADVVRFDATSSDPATANIPAVAGIIIDNGYTGTIDFSSPLAVSGRYRQESGTVLVNPALAFTVNGRFTHNGGTLQETRTVSGGTVNFLKIQTSGGTDVYRGVDLAPSSSLGSTTVSVKAVDLVTEFCTSTGAGSTAYAGRCFNITPGASAAATVTLWAPTSSMPASPRVFHYTSGAWQELTGNADTGTAGSFTWVRGDTTGFSPFLIAQSNGAPTAVTLQSFTADRHGVGWLVVIGLLLMVTVTALLMYKFVSQKKVTVNR